ncbi:vesicle-associated protein 1-3-like [Musa acuminata AAA Group]|uniref:vesicle-associated protein 1-3-like n=1 Tax=Musa acuminata AAA Group TaxID=214697 RepID=UPI0031D649A2
MKDVGGLRCNLFGPGSRALGSRPLQVWDSVASVPCAMEVRAWCNDLRHNLRKGPYLCYVHWDTLVFLLFNFGCVIITYTTNHQFNKEPGKVVDEFKLRVTYVPAGPPSPVPEEPEEGSSTLENGLHSLQTQDSVSRSSEPSKEKSSEALAMISKLTEEKHTAIQQNQKASAGTGAVRNQEYIAKDSENASTGTMTMISMKEARYLVLPGAPV